MGAVVRPSPGHHNPPDRRRAAPARFPCALVDTVFKLEKTSNPVGIHIIRDRGTAQTNGSPQNLHQRCAQSLQLSSGQPPSRPSWPYAGAEQALIGVDVAYPGQQTLVQQRGFDRQSPPPEQSRKLFGFDRQRFGSRSGKARFTIQIAKLQTPKPSRVHKPQLLAARQAEPRMGVRRNRGIGPTYQQPPRHPQVHNPLRGGVSSPTLLQKPAARRAKLADNVFSRPMHSQDRAAFQFSGLTCRGCLERLPVRRKKDLHNALAAHAPVDSARDGLHLRQFRHCLIVKEGAFRPGTGALSIVQPTSSDSSSCAAVNARAALHCSR